MYFVNEGTCYAAVRGIMFQFGTTLASLPVGDLYPVVGMHLFGEEVHLLLGLNWIPEEDSLISVDMNEEEWYHLNDIQLNRQVCCQHCCR